MTAILPAVLKDRHCRAALGLMQDSRYRKRSRNWHCPGQPDISFAQMRNLIDAGLVHLWDSRFGTTFASLTVEGRETVAAMRRGRA